MDKLPDHLLVEIFSRLNDSTELARCKCVSKTLNALARHVRSIHLYCSLRRYTKMRSLSKVTPLLTIFDKLISDTQVPIESVSLGMEEPFNCFCDSDYEFEDESYDLFLTGHNFSEHWMTKIGHGLKSLSISEFLPFEKETDMLEVLSYNCHNLVELTLGYACLCAGDMHPMPLLTRLTLKGVCIDESLKKLMESLPCLQVFNFIESICLCPIIYHVNLRELNWTTIDDVPSLAHSSLSIFTPSLAKLELELCTLETLSIHAPLLSYFHLALERVHEFDVDEFQALKTLRLVSSRLSYILYIFPSSETVQNLTFDSPNSDGMLLRRQCAPLPLDEIIEFSEVFTEFPNVISLTLGSEVWSKQMVYPLAPAPVVKGLRARNEMKDLKQITVYLVQNNFDKTLSFIIYIVGICSKLTDIVLFIHRDVDMGVAISFVLSCTSQCPKVRFRCGTWKEGTKDLILGAANTV